MPRGFLTRIFSPKPIVVEEEKILCGPTTNDLIFLAAYPYEALDTASDVMMEALRKRSEVIDGRVIDKTETESADYNEAAIEKANNLADEMIELLNDPENSLFRKANLNLNIAECGDTRPFHRREERLALCLSYINQMKELGIEDEDEPAVRLLEERATRLEVRFQVLSEFAIGMNPNCPDPELAMVLENCTIDQRGLRFLLQMVDQIRAGGNWKGKPRCQHTELVSKIPAFKRKLRFPTIEEESQESADDEEEKAAITRPDSKHVETIVKDDVATQEKALVLKPNSRITDSAVELKGEPEDHLISHSKTL